MLRLLLRSDEAPWCELRLWLVPRLARALLSVLILTLRVRLSGFARFRPHLSEFRARGEREGALLVMWHDHTLLPLFVLRSQGIGALMSASRDGRLQGALWSLNGWPVIEGSRGKKGAVAALRQGCAWIEAGGTFGLTPDGPRGPRHQAHPGAVYIASKTGCPVFPLGVAADRYWLLPSWDRFLLPRPGARVQVHIGAPLFVPGDLDREGTAFWQEKMRVSLEEANELARHSLQSASSRADAGARSKQTGAQ